MLQLSKKLLSLVFCFSAVQASHAGFGLETTRVIYSEKDRNQSVVAFNTDKNTSYLAQSWIENEKGDISPDFIATPPLLKLRPQQKNTIQLTKNITLSPEKETLYWLNVKFIAPTPVDAENVLKYSMTNRIKMIYRPTMVGKLSLEEEVKKVSWSIQNNQLILNNPSPFYINIAEISVNGHELKSKSYIAPNSTEKLAIGFSAMPQSKIAIKYINDYGTSVLLEP